MFYKLENNNDNQQYKDSESATFSKNFILIDFQNNKIFKCLACKDIIDVANNLNFNDLLDVSNFMNKTTCSSCFLITDYYYFYINNQFKFIYGINPNFEKFGKTSDFVIFCWDFESFIDINLVIPQNIIDDIHNIHFYIEELYI